CIFFGLVLWDVFAIPLPNLGAKKIEAKGALSVFLVGLISGLVVGPCAAPVLGTILVYVAAKQNLIYGISLLFCFAFGLCALLILAGTFSSILVNLPKSGAWMGRVKKLCGALLILTGEYFLIQAGRYFIW
ncbi:MAG: cytochrome c biogenesis protein CcdA, partial [Candidatus Omnitrophica bacterium]|nr:cytochrome c biogenesis protein CcdA [Candidatus Omnitrophota bacterium]